MEIQEQKSQQAQLYFRSYLERRFAELKSTTPGYSLRQFSADLGQNPAAISQIFSGKRNVSLKFAEKLLEKLSAKPMEFQDLQRVFSLCNDAKPNDKDKTNNKDSLQYGRTALDLDQYELIAEWYYFAILSLAMTDDFSDDVAWVAKRLAIAPTIALRALKRLEKLGLLVKDQKGRLKHAGQPICSTDGIRSIALRARHEANLNGAKQALLTEPLEKRDFTFVTFASSLEKLDQARAKIRNFLNEFSDFMEEGAKSEVYEMGIQLFPRSKSLGMIDIDSKKKR